MSLFLSQTSNLIVSVTSNVIVSVGAIVIDTNKQKLPFSLSLFVIAIFSACSLLASPSSLFAVCDYRHCRKQTITIAIVGVTMIVANMHHAQHQISNHTNHKQVLQVRLQWSLSPKRRQRPKPCTLLFLLLLLLLLLMATVLWHHGS